MFSVAAGPVACQKTTVGGWGEGVSSDRNAKALLSCLDPFQWPPISIATLCYQKNNAIKQMSPLKEVILNSSATPLQHQKRELKKTHTL